MTDMGSTTGLGLNMVESEIISPENLFGEELNFQFYELSSPSQLQSAWHTDDNGNELHVILIDELQIQDIQVCENVTIANDSTATGHGVT